MRLIGPGYGESLITSKQESTLANKSVLLKKKLSDAAAPTSSPSPVSVGRIVDPNPVVQKDPLPLQFRQRRPSIQMELKVKENERSNKKSERSNNFHRF
jgi:hypothetical protein